MMKKTILLSVILGLSVAGTTAQNAIPNPGFENWTNFGSYEDPDDWGTLNSQIPSFLGITVAKATGADVNSGSFAVKLETIQAGFDIAPGLAITGIINTGNATFDGGVAYNLRPCSISGWYKYSPSGTDTGMVEVTFSKLNTDIGSGKFIVTNTVNTYANFTATINYTSSEAPDTFMIVLTSSSFDDPQVGSIMFIDDLTFNLESNITASGPLVFCSVDNLTLTSTAATSYQWYLDGNPISGAISQSYNPTASGNYTVEVTDNGCTVTSAPITVTLNPSPVIDSISSTNVTVCGANDGTITIIASGGTPSLQYSIDGGSNFFGNGTFTNLNTGSYTVVVSDVNNCTVTGSTLNITAPGAPPAPTAGTNATYCDGDVVASLTATGTNIEWFSDAGLTIFLGTGSPFAITPAVGTTTYYVTQTVSGCQSPADSVVIVVNATPSPPTAGTNTSYCDGDPAADLTATGTNIEWFSDAGLTNQIGTNSPFAIAPSVGTTTYYVTQTVSSCQSPASTVAITVNPVPIINTQTPTNATSCTSNDGAINITASGGTPPLLYSIDNGANFSSSGNFTSLSTGSYPVVVSDANGCTVTGDTLIITAPGQPPAPTAGTNATYCNGDAMAGLTATAGSGGTLTWYADAGLTNIIDTGTTLTPDTTTGTTTYYVTETVSGCESPSNSVVITVNLLPMPIITPGDTLTASSASTYQWNLNGSPITNATSQSYIATTTGSYTVTVTDINGCTNTSDTVNVTISGINQYSINNNQLKIYPNPTSDELFILSNTVGAKLLIVDLLGKEISEIVLNKSINKLNTSAYSNGIYIYNLIDTNKNLLERGKLIISR